MGRTKGSGAGSVYKRGNKWRGQNPSYPLESQHSVFPTKIVYMIV